MGSLGKIEAVAKSFSGEKDTISLLGEDLELRVRPNGFDALKWTALAGEDAETEEEQGRLGVRLANAAYELLVKCLTPAALKRFEDICAENELGLDVVLNTAKLLIGAASGRPTQKPSDSSDGQSSGGTSSSSAQVGLRDYVEIVGQPLVSAEHWADLYLAKAG
jgi:hypothetical protein